MSLWKQKKKFFSSGAAVKTALWHYFDLKNDPNYEVVGLVTTFDRAKNRVRFHGIPDNLILEQSKLLKLPLQRIFLPEDATNEQYIKEVTTILSMYAKRGIKTVAFGDINLAEIKTFKEKMLAEIGMKAIFPLWGQDTRVVVNRFFSTGHKALVTSVYGEKLGYNFLACEFNEEYINRLPEGVDPAGENGEFHTFVTFGPSFKMRVAYSKSIAVEEGPYLVSLIKEP